MRILVFLGKSLVTLAIISVIVALLGREILLLTATAQVKGDLNRLRHLSQDGDAGQMCREKGTVMAQGEEYAQAQLRFTSDTEYSLEVVCGQFSFDPIEVSKVTLVPLVHKVPGQSGIVWGEGPSGIQLEILGRRQTIAVIGEVAAAGVGAENLGEGPANSCSGFGFKCCQEESQAGIGEQLTEVTDCPRSCYSSCTARPLVLSFTSEPFFDSRTREVTVGEGETVTFAMVVDQGQGQSVTTQLSFGDGQVETLSGEKNVTSHAYTCDSDTCLYTATLTVSDDRGVTANPSLLDTIKIVVK